MIQERVIREFRTELDRSKLPGYRSTYDDYDPEDAVTTNGAAHSRERTVTKTQVQPAETQPRSPHKPLVNHGAPQVPHRSSVAHPVNRDGFGAGIF
jgi:hypothetical protein